MLDFACKRFDINDVIKCSLGLTKADYAVLAYFAKHSDKVLTTEQIAVVVGVDVSTAQRATKKLTEAGVLERRQHNLDKGGYTYLYTLADKKQVRKVILDIVDKWKLRVAQELKSW